MLRDADLRLRQKGDEWWIHSYQGPDCASLQSVPLQGANGRLRRDVENRLQSEIDDDEANNILSRLGAHGYPQKLESRNKLHDFQVRFLFERDSIKVIKDLLDFDPAIRLFQIRPTRKLILRESIWRLIAKTQDDGKSWAERADDGEGVPRTDRVSSFAPFMPALFVCGPLIATDYPVGMVFVTPRGIQLLALSEQACVHPESLGSWPFGFPVTVLGSSGGVRTIQKPDWSSGESLSRFLNFLISGANKFLDQLTDPFTWKADSNEINAIEQRIVWTSVLMGLESVVQMGKEWTNPESVWTAFRSLTMLEGLWGPWSLSERRLRMLLDPCELRKYAISQFPHDDYKEWAQTICDEYETQLRGIPEDGDLASALDLVETIRHLLHGAGGQSKRRTDKIRALEAIRGLDIDLVKHVAIIWWTSIVLAPETNGIPGNAPFPKYTAAS